MRSAAKIGLLAVVVTTAGVTPLSGAGADPVKARIESYRELGASFKNVNDELRKPTPQPYIIQLSAKQIRSVAQAQYGFFPKGSGPRTGLKTAAKPEIWSQPAQFKKAQDAFNMQAQAFAKAAQTGDMMKIKLQKIALGQTCAACHKAFRVEK